MRNANANELELKNTYGLERVKTGTLQREGMRSLLRRPVVQAVLVIAAAVQVVAVQQEAKAGGALAMELAPVVVTPEMAAVPDVSLEAIAAEYEAEGYDLSLSLAEEIHEAAAVNGIDPEVAFGLVRAESSFRNAATSTVGAVGLTSTSTCSNAALKSFAMRRRTFCAWP